MKNYKYNKQKYIGLYCVVFIILLFLFITFLNLEFNDKYLVATGLMGGLLFFVYAFAHYKIVRRFMNFGLIFTTMLFLFCFGQFFLYGLGIEYEYFFLNDYYSSLFKHNQFYVLYGEVVSILSIGTFQLAMLLSAKRKDKRNSKKTSIKNRSLKAVAQILFCISFPIMFVNKIYLMVHSLSYGYAATAALPQSTVMRFLGVFIIPAAISLLVCVRNNKKKFKMLCIVLFVYSLMGLVVGGRTEPVILMVGIAILTLYENKLNFKTSVVFLLVVYFAITLLVTVAETRGSNVEFSGMIGLLLKNLVTLRPIIQLIGEMGFSGSSMVWTVYLIKTGQQELFFGVTYFSALVNIFPSSLDPFGLLDILDKYCHLEGWLTEIFGFNFGVGFNLIAEAYLNFGFGSILIMFLYGLLLNHIFNFELKSGNWNLYKSLVMFVVLMTLPRRATLYFVDQWMLCIIVMWLFCQIIALFRKKSQRELLHEKITH